MIAWEKPTRAWLTAQLGSSVMSGFPMGTPRWPVVTLERIGGQPVTAEEHPRIRLRVWNESKDNAEKLIVQAGNLLEGLGKTEIEPGLWLAAADIHRLAWSPDWSLDGKPSYILDATLVFISDE